MERVNVDFEESKEELWAFVGGKTKGNIASLRNEAGVSVTSTKGKLEVFQSI